MRKQCQFWAEKQKNKKNKKSSWKLKHDTTAWRSDTTQCSIPPPVKTNTLTGPLLSFSEVIQNAWNCIKYISIIIIPSNLLLPFGAATIILIILLLLHGAWAFHTIVCYAFSCWKVDMGSWWTCTTISAHVIYIYAWRQDRCWSF